MQLIDSFGRTINYLRLSVTDRCNLRCTYCMPAQGVGKLARRDVLRYEELHRIATTAVAIGIEKIRVTGGEPLIRRGIIDFLARLSAIRGLRQLVLTTNGHLLEEMAESLHAAGVQRLNISLDSLHPETFSRITRCGSVERVLTGINAAERMGFPIKLNMVVMRGVNDAEILDFAALTLDRPYAVRFIEYMPAVRESGWQRLAMPGSEILARIEQRFSFQPVERNRLAGPAREFRIRGAAGTIGVITAVSCHFCQECNRIRITSAGMAQSCLFSEASVDLKPFLAGGEPQMLEEALRRVVSIKPDGHGASGDGPTLKPFTMATIGG